MAWTNRSLNDAFTQWKANFRILRADRERVAVAVARMVYRRAYGYFNAWADTVTERRQRRAIVRRTLARIMRRCASSAFYHRLDLVDARRAAARDEEATRAAKLERARRFVLAWVKRSFSLAFIRWRSNARSIAASRTKAAKCAARLTRRRAASALSRWIEFAAESRRLRVVVRRCVQKMRRRARRRVLRVGG